MPLANVLSSKIKLRRIIMNYVDGFVAAVPAANKEKYLKHATDALAVFKEYGALRVVDVGVTMSPKAS
jgi:uncharacterized protein YbaA (DUF1428 family)